MVIFFLHNLYILCIDNIDFFSFTMYIRPFMVFFFFFFFSSFFFLHNLYIPCVDNIEK